MRKRGSIVTVVALLGAAVAYGEAVRHDNPTEVLQGVVHTEGGVYMLSPGCTTSVTIGGLPSIPAGGSIVTRLDEVTNGQVVAQIWGCRATAGCARQLVGVDHVEGPLHDPEIRIVNDLHACGTGQFRSVRLRYTVRR